MRVQFHASFLIVCLTAFALSTPGQATISRITFSSPPAAVTACVTGYTTIGNSTYFEVTVPAAFNPRVSAANVKGVVSGDDIVFTYVLKKDGVVVNEAVECEAAAGELRVTLTARNTAPAAPPLPSGGSGTPGTAAPPTPVAVATIRPTPANAVVPPVTNTEVKKAEEEALDLSIPESPGFTILGLNPQEVTRPATPREFATAIINSIDRYGNFQSGIAVDTAPYQLFFGNRVTRDDYVDPQDNKDPEDRKRETAKGYLTRLLWRTQFSLATTKGATESDKSARLGTGLNFTFLDFGDVNTDHILVQCQRDLNRTLLIQAFRDLGFSGPTDPRVTPEIVRQANARRLVLRDEVFLTQYEKCADDAKERNLGRTSLGVGVAGSWISKSGDSSDFTNNGQALWASLNYGFEGIPGLRCTEEEIQAEGRCVTPQLILHFRRRVKETVPDPLAEGNFTTKDTNLLGMRLRVGVPNWSVNFEGVYQAGRYAGRTSSSNIQASIGADYKLARNLYLNFSIGGETKESNIPNTGKVFVRTSFNWGTTEKPKAP